MAQYRGLASERRQRNINTYINPKNLSEKNVIRSKDKGKTGKS
jgi:hypothetical protein